jgi:hypothetical protein
MGRETPGLTGKRDGTGREHQTGEWDGKREMKIMTGNTSAVESSPEQVDVEQQGDPRQVP